MFKLQLCAACLYVRIITIANKTILISLHTKTCQNLQHIMVNAGEIRAKVFFIKSIKSGLVFCRIYIYTLSFYSRA